jgi:hypothetical protein
VSDVKTTIRLEVLAGIALALAASLFAALYFSPGAQFDRAVDRSASWCKTEAEKAQLKKLATYVLPSEKALMVRILKDLQDQGRAKCSLE